MRGLSGAYLAALVSRLRTTWLSRVVSPDTTRGLSATASSTGGPSVAACSASAPCGTSPAAGDCLLRRVGPQADRHLPAGGTVPLRRVAPPLRGTAVPG